MSPISSKPPVSPIKRWVGVATAIISSLGLPFLLVITLGLIFEDARGNPFSSILVFLVVFSPSLLLIGASLAFATVLNRRARSVVVITDGILLVFIILGVAVIRSLNAR